MIKKILQEAHPVKGEREDSSSKISKLYAQKYNDNLNSRSIDANQYTARQSTPKPFKKHVQPEI